MNALFFFLFGIIFCVFIQPLLEGLSEVILCFFEMLRMKIGVTTVKYTTIIQEAQKGELTEDIHIVGFTDGGEEE